MHEVKVWGDVACFTRPESKVERVSYEVMTPGAARGVLEAIYWKPEFSWEVREIRILNPIRSTTLTTNEINHRQSEALARRGEIYLADSTGGLKGEPQHRTQRHNVLLRDVAYVIRAKMVLAPHKSTEYSQLAKHEAIFDRRLRKGRCFHQPYLGIREYAAFFEAPNSDETPQPITMDLGRMHYDVHFVPDERGPLTFRYHHSGEDRGARTVNGRAVPLFFDARLVDGVLKVPTKEAVLRRNAGTEDIEEKEARP